MSPSAGAELAQLLLGGFEAMVDEVVDGLARRGHPGVRPVHEFTLGAIDAGARTASDLGRHLGVSKQAAAKTIATLKQLGYVEVQTDPDDARRQLLLVTDRGREMVTLGAALFDQVRQRWAAQVGPAALADVERHLRQLVGPRPASVDQPAGSAGSAAAVPAGVQPV